MRNTGLDEAQAGNKVARRNISNLRYANDPNLMAESKEELKTLLVKVKEESGKTGLKLNIQKTKIMASGPISSVQLCLTLCNPMNHSTPGLSVHHQLLESTQTYVHWVGDAIQPAHPLSYPSPPALNLSQHQGLFKWVMANRWGNSGNSDSSFLGLHCSVLLANTDVQDQDAYDHPTPPWQKVLKKLY